MEEGFEMESYCEAGNSLILPRERLTTHISNCRRRGIPEELWSQGPSHVGLMKGVQPVPITPKRGYRPHVRQYPLKPEAEERIEPVTLKRAGDIDRHTLSRFTM